MYHWKALNWLLKFVGLPCTRLPNRFAGCFCCCCGCIVDCWCWIGMFEYCGFCWGDVTLPPIRFGWMPTGGTSVDVDLTGLWTFSWFIEGAGPVFFDFPDKRLSRSMPIEPAFDHVDPTGMAAAAAAIDDLEAGVIISSKALLLCGWRMLLDGWRILSVKF